MSRRPPLPDRGPLEDAFESFTATKHQLSVLVNSNPELFGEYYKLLESLNAANERIRASLRTASYDRIGPFRKSVKKRTEIDVSRLIDAFPEAVNLEGLIVPTLNKAVLDGYVMNGSIPTDVVEQVTVELTPQIKVYGPKPTKGDF